jgi:hypothetical protein
MLQGRPGTGCPSYDEEAASSFYSSLKIQNLKFNIPSSSAPLRDLCALAVNTLPLHFDVQCWMFDVGCSMFSSSNALNRSRRRLLSMEANACAGVFSGSGACVCFQTLALAEEKWFAHCHLGSLLSG